MELRLRLHRWEGRSPDLVAAAVAGIAAGAVLMVLELLWSGAMMGEAPWRISQFVAAITMGPYSVLHAPPNVFDPTIVTVALVTHYVLGISFAIVLGAVVAGYHYDDDVKVSLPVIGAIFGALLYLLNFYALTEVFPWFAEMRAWGTFAAHLIFGITAAELYGKLAQFRRQRQAGAL
jgi:hypothetical protein